MADTSVEVANIALTLIGANTISTFVGTGTEQIAATNLYQPIVDAALVSHRWRFASGKAQINLLVATPADDWDSAFQIPADPPVLLINSVSVLDNPIQYDRFEDQIYCDATSDDIVIMDYIYSRDEIDWPPYFTKAVGLELASAFAAAITQDSFLAAHFTEQAAIEFRKARWADSSSQTARNLNPRSLINKRRG
jgi:hypothetical protein